MDRYLREVIPAASISFSSDPTSLNMILDKVIVILVAVAYPVLSKSPHGYFSPGNSRNIQNKKSSKHGFVSIPRDSSTSNTMESEIPRIESSNRKGSCEDPQNLNASSTHWYTSTHHSRASITNIQTKHNTTWQQQQS